MKIFTECELDKPRKMRLGYKAIKEMDARAKKGKMTEIESLEYMLWLALKEDDPDLKIIQIEDILDDCDMSYVKECLEETIKRDMPHLAKEDDGKK